MSHRRVHELPVDPSKALTATRSTAIASNSRTNGLYTASPDGSDVDENQLGTQAVFDGSSGLDQSAGDHQSMLWWGYALLGGSTLSLLVGLWSLLIGPVCRPTGLRVRPAATA